MKQLLLFVVMLISSLTLAQTAQPSPSAPAPVEKTALQQKEEDDRAAAAEKAREKTNQEARDKAKADAEKPKVSENPKPIKKAEEQEDLSRAMLRLQESALQLNNAATKAQSFLAPYVAARDLAAKELGDKITTLQKSHDAEGCEVGIDKKWKKSETCKSKED